MACSNRASWREVDLLRFPRFARRRSFGEPSSKSCAPRRPRGRCTETCGARTTARCRISRRAPEERRRRTRVRIDGGRWIPTFGTAGFTTVSPSARCRARCITGDSTTLNPRAHTRGARSSSFVDARRTSSSPPRSRASFPRRRCAKFACTASAKPFARGAKPCVERSTASAPDAVRATFRASSSPLARTNPPHCVRPGFSRATSTRTTIPSFASSPLVPSDLASASPPPSPRSRVRTVFPHVFVA